MGIFSLCHSEQTDIITKITTGFLDPVYDNSPYVIVTEVPFIGARFDFSKLRINKTSFLRETLGNDSEFFQLFDSSKKAANILSYRFKELYTRPGFRIRFWKCTNYHIIKDGIIKEKQHDVVTKESNINIKFTTLYKYHLVDPKKFLSIYENRERVYKNEDIWDIIQRDVRLRLDKKIMDYIITSDYQELIHSHNNLRFEEILLKDKYSIVNEYGIYIDEAFVTDLILPEDILKESEKIESGRLKRAAQKEGAKIDAENEAYKNSISRAAARNEMLLDSELLKSMDPIAFDRYVRRNHSKNLTSATIIGSNLNEVRPKSVNTNVIGNFKTNDKLLFFDVLYSSGCCDYYGILQEPLIGFLKEYNSQEDVATHIEDLSVDEYYAFINYTIKSASKIKQMKLS